MTAFRTLWMALVGLYEETVVLVGANLAAVALNVVTGLVIVLVGFVLLAVLFVVTSLFGLNLPISR